MDQLRMAQVVACLLSLTGAAPSSLGTLMPRSLPPRLPNCMKPQMLRLNLMHSSFRTMAAVELIQLTLCGRCTADASSFRATARATSIHILNRSHAQFEILAVESR